jgi:hypothetical protein
MKARCSAETEYQPSQRHEIEHLGSQVVLGSQEHRQETQQHRDAASHRINEKLRGRRSALRAAPELHQEERRHQAQFPEEKPVEEIQRAKGSKQAGL